MTNCAYLNGYYLCLVINRRLSGRYFLYYSKNLSTWSNIIIMVGDGYISNENYIYYLNGYYYITNGSNKGGYYSSNLNTWSPLPNAIIGKLFYDSGYYYSFNGSLYRGTQKDLSDLEFINAIDPDSRVYTLNIFKINIKIVRIFKILNWILGYKNIFIIFRF